MKQLLILVVLGLLVAPAALSFTNDDIFKTLNTNIGSKAEATFTIYNPIATTTLYNFNVNFNNKCGGIDRYKIFIEKDCATTIPVYGLEELCHTDNKTIDKHCHNQSIQTGTKQTTEKCWVEAQNIPLGTNKFKIDARPIWGNCGNGWGYQADWIPSLKLSGIDYSQPKWAWFNASFLYRQNLTIENNDDQSVQDYEMKIEINTGNDASGWDWNNNGSDVRFVNESGYELHHFIEYWDDDKNFTMIWVNLTSFPGSHNTTVYMYYGNDTATSTSDGENVFYKWDSMSVANRASFWNYTSGADYSVDDTAAKRYWKGVSYMKQNDTDETALMDKLPRNSYRVRFAIKRENSANIVTNLMWGDGSHAPYHVIQNDNHMEYYTSAYSSNQHTFLNDHWTIIEYSDFWFNETYTWDWIVNELNESTDHKISNDVAMRATSNYNKQLSLSCSLTGSNLCYFDNFFIAKYIRPVPTVAKRATADTYSAGGGGGADCHYTTNQELSGTKNCQNSFYLNGTGKYINFTGDMTVNCTVFQVFAGKIKKMGTNLLKIKQP